MLDRPDVQTVQSRLQAFHDRLAEREIKPVCIWCLAPLENDDQAPFCSTECAALAANDDEREERS